MATKEKKVAKEDVLYTVYLEKGETFTTPWGKKLFKKKPVDIHSSDPHIAYYRGNTRFRVEEANAGRRSAPERKRVPMNRRRKAAMDTERAQALAERKEIGERAKELGITLTKNDTVESVKKKIESAENEQRRGRKSEDDKEEKGDEKEKDSGGKTAG